jgi:flavin-binding protein dodecin
MPAHPRKSAPGSVVRLTEVTGASSRSWDAAVAVAVKASEVKDPVGVEISRMWAEWARGRLSRYHVTVRVAYRQTLKAETRR